MIKLVSIVGARPQFVKAAVVSRMIVHQQAKGSRHSLSEVLVHTGQHYDANMSDIFFEEMGIPAPSYHLGIAGGSHGRMTGRMLEAIEEVLLAELPDMVLVYGDTNSTLAAALAAAKLHLPVAHVEAGLRSFNRRMPEEVNRVLTDHVSELLFAPTATAVNNLKREAVSAEGIHLVGDVMYDAAILFGDQAARTSGILERLGVVSGEYVLATIHRAENTGDPRRLRAILDGLSAVARDVPIVLPMHPRVRQTFRGGTAAGLDGVTVIDPVGYLDMVMLERSARLIVTDSGGVQKEAYFHRVPCVTLRDETEWVELVETGWNTLLPPVSREEVADGLRAALTSPPRDGASAADLYGDGTAAEQIVRILSQRE